MIFESIWLYKWTILSAMAIAPALALVGAQSLARGWSHRALLVGQGTSFGTYFGLLIISWLGWVHDSGQQVEDFKQFILILFISVVVAALIGIFTIWIENRFLRAGDPVASQVAIAFFAMLLALSALVVALSPHLESHLASAFIGDLSTASDLESRLTFGLGLGVLGWIWWKWQDLTRSAFLRGVLLKESAFKGTSEFLFSAVALLAMALTVHSMGVLFVLGSLFVPSSLLSLASRKDQSLLVFRWQLGFTAAVGSALGFVVSLIFTNFPTAPLIVFFQAAVSVLTGWLFSKISGPRDSRKINEFVKNA
jgi:zinc/manganese transport system permease protein